MTQATTRRPVSPRSAGRALFGLSNAAAVIIANAATGLVGSRLVGPEGRGSIAIVAVFGALSLTAASFGIPEAVTVSKLAPDDQSRSKHIGFSAIAAVPAAAVLLVIAAAIGSTGAGEPVRFQLLVLALLMPIRSAGLSAAFALLAKGKVALHQALITSIPVAILMFVLGAWLAGRNSLSDLAWAVVFGLVGSALTQLL